MPIGAQRGGLGTADQLVEIGRSGVEQDQRVLRQGADVVGQDGALAVGGERRDHQLAAAGPVGDQRGEGGEQDDGRAGAGAAADGGEVVGRPARTHQQRRVVARRAGDPGVGEDGLRAGAEDLRPVPQGRGRLAPALRALLRGGDPQRGRRGDRRQFPPGGEGVPLLDQHGGGRAVGARVADHGDQPQEPLAPGDDGEPDPWGRRRIHRHGDVDATQLCGQCVDFAIVELSGLDHRHREPAVRVHHLAVREAVRAGAGGKGGAQRLVPLDQQPQRGQAGRDRGAGRDRPGGLPVDLLGGLAPDAAEHVVLAAGERADAAARGGEPDGDPPGGRGLGVRALGVRSRLGLGLLVPGLRVRSRLGRNQVVRSHVVRAFRLAGKGSAGV